MFFISNSCHYFLRCCHGVLLSGVIFLLYQNSHSSSSDLLSNTHCLFTDWSRVQEDLLEVMPAVEEANSISEELDKLVKFEILMVAPQVLGNERGRTEVSCRERQVTGWSAWPVPFLLTELWPFIAKTVLYWYLEHCNACMHTQKMGIANWFCLSQVTETACEKLLLKLIRNKSELLEVTEKKTLFSSKRVKNMRSWKVKNLSSLHVAFSEWYIPIHFFHLSSSSINSSCLLIKFPNDSLLPTCLLNLFHWSTTFICISFPNLTF